MTETNDEEETERGIETEEMIAIVGSDEDRGHLTTEPPSATTKATHILLAETTEQENEKIDMVDEVEVNEMSASGTVIVALVGEMMETDHLDVTAIYLMSDEVVVETEVNEVGEMAAARTEMSSPRRLGAAKRAHRLRRRRENRRQT